MNEAKIQTKITQWCKAFWQFGSAGIEVKYARTSRMLFTAVMPHQYNALRIANDSNLVYKIPDEGRAQKPFDMVILDRTHAYVCVVWHRPRKATLGYLVPIGRLIAERDKGDKKSLTEYECAMIAERVLDLT